MSKVKTTNTKQFEKLVSLMEQKPELARGFNKGLSKAEVQQEWDHIAKSLNSYGPPERDAYNWQKIWADMKSSVKKKIIHNYGDSVNPAKLRRPYILSALQETVATMMGFDQLVVNIDASSAQPTPPSGSTSPTTNFEFATTSLSSNAAADDMNAEYIEGINSDDEQMPQNNNTTQSDKSGNRYKKNSTKDKLLRKQTEVQTALYKEISQYLQETQLYQKRRCGLEEAKLKLYKIKMERQEKQWEEENKLKLMEIELLKRRIELEERKLEMLETDSDEDKPLSARQKMIRLG